MTLFAPPNRSQSLRVSALTGTLASLTVLAPVVGSAVAWFGAGRGSTLFAPVRVADRAAPVTSSGFDAPITSSEAVDLHARNGISAGVAFVDHPVDVAFTLLAASGPVLVGLTVGALAALLVGIVRSLVTREPFAAGIAPRLVGSAGVLVLASVLATVLPFLAARRLLALPYVSAGDWVPDLQPVLWPLPAAGVLLVLAAAVHAGSGLRRETAGLV